MRLRRPLLGPVGAATIDRRDLPAYFLCFLAGLVFNMFSGYSKLLGFPIGPDRLLFAASFVLLIFDRQARRQHVGGNRAIYWLMPLMIAVTAWSASLHGTLTSHDGFYALLDRLVVPFAVFIAAPWLLSTPARRDLLLRALVVIGFYLSITAVFEIIGPHLLVFPRYILDPHVGIQFGRARGPFAESESDGFVIASCGFAAAYAAVRLPGRWRAFSILTTLLCGLGVLLCLTRSVWLGALLGTLSIMLFEARLRRYLLPLLAVAAIALSVTFATVPRVHHLVTQRTDSQRPIDDRRNTNAAALRIIDARPLSGVGWERFVSDGYAYVRQAPTYPVTTTGIEVHNVYLSRAAELGLPAAGLFVLCLAFGPVAGVMRRPPPGDLEYWRLVARGILLCWLVGSLVSPMSYPLFNILTFLVGGLLFASSTSRLPGPADAQHQPVRVPVTVREAV